MFFFFVKTSLKDVFVVKTSLKESYVKRQGICNWMLAHKLKSYVNFSVQRHRENVNVIRSTDFGDENILTRFDTVFRVFSTKVVSPTFLLCKP